MVPARGPTKEALKDRCSIEEDNEAEDVAPTSKRCTSGKEYSDYSSTVQRLQQLSLKFELPGSCHTGTGPEGTQQGNI